MTRIAVACTVLLAVLLGWQTLRLADERTAHAQTRAQWAQHTADIADAIAKEIERTRGVEARLHEAAARQRKEAKDEKKRITAELDDVLRRLRDRPEARAEGDGGVPQGSAAGTGCTGAGLARPDAAFLAGYAADAALMQAALLQCKARYSDIERALNGR